jgi:hypothetical protein
MTKRVLLICAAAIIVMIVIAGWFGFHYVPLPFASVTRRDHTVVATLRPGRGFAFMRERTRIGEHIAGSGSLDLQDGESVTLGSGHTSYRITCRVSPRPAGLFIQGSWSLHDFLRSAEKTWFMEAQ